MRICSLRSLVIAASLSLFMIGSLGSCKSQKTNRSFTDLQHARELDKKKGKRLKKLQKNVARQNDY